VRQVGYLQELRRDAMSTEHKIPELETQKLKIILI
jgi:hypothetical protein